MPSFREQLAQALEASRAEEPELALEDYGRRVPLDQRPPKPPRDPPTWSQDADGVRTLRHAQQAPRLDFVRAVQRGTIVDGYGNRVAGTVYDEATDQPIESSALNAHPDPRAVSSDGCKAARVLTEENVKEDLEAPFISPPAAGEEAAWKGSLPLAVRSCARSVFFLPMMVRSRLLPTRRCWGWPMRSRRVPSSPTRRRAGGMSWLATGAPSRSCSSPLGSHA